MHQRAWERRRQQLPRRFWLAPPQHDHAVIHLSMPLEFERRVEAESRRIRSVHVHLYRASSWAGLLDGMHEVSHMLLATKRLLHLQLMHAHDQQPKPARVLLLQTPRARRILSGGDTLRASSFESTH